MQVNSYDELKALEKQTRELAKKIIAKRKAIAAKEKELKKLNDDLVNLVAQEKELFGAKETK